MKLESVALSLLFIVLNIVDWYLTTEISRLSAGLIGYVRF